MDWTLIRSVMTVVSLATFLGIILWAYSGRRRAEFEAAGRLALDEDELEGAALPAKKGNAQ